MNRFRWSARSAAPDRLDPGCVGCSIGALSPLLGNGAADRSTSWLSWVMLCGLLAPRRGERSCDVGLAEIPALEEQRLGGCPREGVGEAVTEVEAGRVTALAEVRVRLPGDMGLLLGEGLDDDAGAADQRIELASAAGIGLRLDDDRGLNEAGSGKAYRVGVGKGPVVALSVGLVEQDGEQG